MKSVSKGLVMMVMMCCAGCFAGSTRHIPAVTGFNADAYLGLWYEIARADHRFERNLTHVTATYSRDRANRINVLNRGYNTVKGKWVQAEARAVFRGRDDLAELSVTFFWPFSAQYRVIELGSQYEYAVVTSSSLKYFWILSREPVMDDSVLNGILARAGEWGFDTQNLILVEQSPERIPPDSGAVSGSD